MTYYGRWSQCHVYSRHTSLNEQFTNQCCLCTVSAGVLHTLKVSFLQPTVKLCYLSLKLYYLGRLIIIIIITTKNNNNNNIFTLGIIIIIIKYDTTVPMIWFVISVVQTNRLSSWNAINSNNGSQFFNKTSSNWWKLRVFLLTACNTQNTKLVTIEFGTIFVTYANVACHKDFVRQDTRLPQTNHGTALQYVWRWDSLRDGKPCTKVSYQYYTSHKSA